MCVDVRWCAIELLITSFRACSTTDEFSACGVGF
jgi:hypothetical protein